MCQSHLFMAKNLLLPETRDETSSPLRPSITASKSPNTDKLQGYVMLKSSLGIPGMKLWKKKYLVINGEDHNLLVYNSAKDFSGVQLKIHFSEIASVKWLKHKKDGRRFDVISKKQGDDDNFINDSDDGAADMLAVLVEDRDLAKYWVMQMINFISEFRKMNSPKNAVVNSAVKSDASVGSGPPKLTRMASKGALGLTYSFASPSANEENDNRVVDPASPRDPLKTNADAKNALNRTNSVSSDKVRTSSDDLFTASNLSLTGDLPQMRIKRAQTVDDIRSFDKVELEGYIENLSPFRRALWRLLETHARLYAPDNEQSSMAPGALLGASQRNLLSGGGIGPRKVSTDGFKSQNSDNDCKSPGVDRKQSNEKKIVHDILKEDTEHQFQISSESYQPIMNSGSKQMHKYSSADSSNADLDGKVFSDSEEESNVSNSRSRSRANSQNSPSSQNSKKSPKLNGYKSDEKKNSESSSGLDPNSFSAQWIKARNEGRFEFISTQYKFIRINWCFSADYLIQFLVNEKICDSELKAIEIGEHLTRNRIIQRIDQHEDPSLYVRFENNEFLFFITDPSVFECDRDNLEYESKRAQLKRSATLNIVEDIDFRADRFQVMEAFQQIDIWIHQLRLPDSGVTRSTNKKNFKRLHNSFKGESLIEWVLSESKLVRNREEAFAFASELFHHGIIVSASEKSQKFKSSEIYRMSSDLNSLELETQIRHEVSRLQFRQFFLTLDTDSQILHLLLHHLSQSKNAEAPDLESFRCPAVGCYVSFSEEDAEKMKNRHLEDLNICPIHQIELVPNRSYKPDSATELNAGILCRLLLRYTRKLDVLLEKAFESQEKHAASLAIDLKWELTKKQIHHSHVCNDRNSCTICIDFHDQFAIFCSKVGVRKVYSKFVKNSLIATLIDEDWSMYKPLALGQDIIEPGAWKAYFTAMISANDEMISDSLVDVNALLMDHPTNWQGLVRQSGWQSWIVSQCLRHPRRILHSDELKGISEDYNITNNQKISIGILVSVHFNLLKSLPNFTSILCQTMVTFQLSPEAVLNGSWIVGSTFLYSLLSRCLNSRSFLVTDLRSDNLIWKNIRGLVEAVICYIFCTESWGSTAEAANSIPLFAPRDVMEPRYGAHFYNPKMFQAACRCFEALYNFLKGIKVMDAEDIRSQEGDDKMRHWLLKLSAFILDLREFLTILKGIKPETINQAEIQHVTQKLLNHSPNDRKSILSKFRQAFGVSADQEVLIFSSAPLSQAQNSPVAKAKPIVKL